ncbi:MAG: hypothetical protein D6B27_07865 [Gammaproteobacteria bacterium]|mgnify:CR=1 FL=1|nr:MAG: hypothetical protein D6B27_07865 [Gammaproteobacteria bacterium]
MILVSNICVSSTRALVFFLLLFLSVNLVNAAQYSWDYSSGSEPLFKRVKPPTGYSRNAHSENSFSDWLVNLPVKKGEQPVYLYNGKRKFNQLVHFAVIDIDTGKRDLQQCADAVMRLRAEYLWSSGRKNEIAFNYTSGDRAYWKKWRKGIRPQIKGNKVKWINSAANDKSYANFRRYMDNVFTYAGSASLSRELQKVSDPQNIRSGDVFIQGGHPGHAVIVLDVVENSAGERLFLLAQSYMPAQEIHILKNPLSPQLSPWYKAKKGGELVTPEWLFEYGDLKRFNGSF